MVLALAAIVCASIALFFIVQDSLMHAIKDTFLKGGPLAIAAVVLAKLLVDQSKHIRSHPEPRGFNNLLKASLYVALMFLTVAGLVGWQLGTRRYAFDAMITDWAHLSQVGRRISDQRNATDNLEGQLAMYKAIESDVADMDTTASRLLDEERQFADRYPEYRMESEKESADVQVCLNRARLLQQQIAVAKKISAQDLQQRPVLWVRQMQPLLDAESALDGSAAQPSATDEPAATDNDD